ncbi:MAG: DUF1836 domain-containing protein [Coriobacteriaceae bacterium]|nr:DUF1836 domain-containing protein [Coriobacteriaceae bacterium]
MSDVSAKITPRDIAPTVLPDDFLDSEVARAARAFQLPAFDELPDLPLYREQVIAYIEQVLSPLADASDGPWLTPSMINNYVKTGLVPAPQKKLYRREQIARLIIICIFKQFLPIPAIKRMLRIQAVSYPVAVAFDYVGVELSQAVRAAFSASAPTPPDTASVVTRESLLVRSAVAAFTSKAFLLTYLRFTGFER